MYNNENIDRLKQDLLLLPKAKPVNTPTELAVCRCAICGDSVHEDSAHMYIGVKEVNGKELIVYDCKLCSSSGIVTPTLLRRLGVHDLAVEEYLKSTMSSGYVKTFNEEDDTTKLVYKYPMPTAKEKDKIDYLYRRLGIDFNNYDNIKRYKVVLNFSKFLKMNKIEHPRVSSELIPLIDELGCGFVSADKTSINFRNIRPDDMVDEKRRIAKINSLLSLNINPTEIERFEIIHLYQNIKRPFFYVPPISLDVLTYQPTIAVSESCFNIINVSNYFYGEDNTSVIMGSSSRKGCARTVQRLIELSGYVGGKLDIYCDNDKTFSVDYFQRILEPYQSTFDITLYLSTEGKDFGELPKNGGKYSFETIKI